LITGTNSGFGYLTAKGAAAKGHKVYAAMRNTTTRNAEKAKELSEVENINVVEIDVTDAAQVKSAIEGIIAQEGRLDVLVNNAGYYGGGITETFTEEDMENMFNVNVKGPWRTMKSALPQMRKQGDGLIINISSGLGRFSAPFMTVYNSTKFALEGLTEGIHYEVRPLGVDAVIIEPGAFPTEIFSKTAYGSDQEIAAEYGELAAIPEQMGQGMQQMFEQLKPSPQMVPDAIFKLIETPKGKRPLRTVVDAITGQFVESANANVKKDYDNFLTAFGMGSLLN
ncbi:MAG: SDR family oxidoreductase, partial [Eudoraea sp.]|nr:SDR family oxidoreductase [Eudoraea sp.]